MVVCGYCQTTIIKNANEVKDLGKISAVLEDFSPIQIGTTGTFSQRGFTVIGRIQLRYDQGMWNEWYLLFDDGSGAWLGDSSGLFTITTACDMPAPLPEFSVLKPGLRYPIGRKQYTVSEVRSAQCIGGQGELPFHVGDGWTVRVADLRNQGAFLTLDYSESDIPTVYNGHAVLLPELHCQLLRDDEQIKASAGKYRARLDTLNCPSCGSAINYLPGVTPNLICPGCASTLDASGPQATVLAASKALKGTLGTLALGASAKISGKTHTVIGAMRRVDDEDNEWTEYLVYSTTLGFFWLIETDQGWFRTDVLSSWPIPSLPTASQVRRHKQSYTKLYDYPATVCCAAGAFNWRVAVGDQAQVSEFAHGQTTLAAELTEHELTWSASTPLANDQMKAWFGIDVKDNSAPKPKSLAHSQMNFILLILGLNVIPILFAFTDTILITVVALIALIYPGRYLQDSD
jgi:hypothetical protein